MIEFIWSIWLWFTVLMKDLGYVGVVSLMALESSFFPFPSEIVVPPAAANPEMSFLLVVVAGIAGSILGALFNYWIAVRFGRPFIRKYGKYVLIKEKSFDKSERFFRRHGEIGTFVCRLVPGVRQVISFPAGLARMNLFRFTLFTALGSGIWVVILAWIGREIGSEPDVQKVKEMAKERAGPVLLTLVPILGGLLLAYLVWNWKFRRRDEEPGGPAAEGSE